ncbi:MAG TPA: FKBP-type peptidyl-prolyl cis-trans isomerase [Cytophagales bacterium]|nr:FKBP-type peptidyl-prolyl cis-trans isomerase [Cytophagales bacterium]
MKTAIKVLFASVALCSISCGGLKKTENGSEYVLEHDESGDNIKFGDKIIFNYKVINSKDSVLQNSYETGLPGAFQVDSNKFKGQMNEALTKASKGDSITIFEPVDSILAKMPMAKSQPGIIPGSKIKYIFKILHVFPSAQDSLFRATYMGYQQKAFEKQQKKAEEEAQVAQKEEPAKIEAYLKKSGVNFTKTAEGYYINKTKTTTGTQAKKGDKVKVHYTGTLLDGKKFDSSVDRNQPFEFVIGESQVIQGWHLGLAQLKVGEKATLLLPSQLAYGPSGAGADIKPHSPLLFEVELLEILKK